MITKNTTEKEFWQYLKDYRNEINRNGMGAQSRWMELYRQNKGKTNDLTMLYSFRAAGNEWYVIRHTSNFKSGRYNYVNLVLVPVANDKFQYIHWMRGNGLTKYTHHFFDRYEERMHLSCERKQSVKRFFKKNSSFTTIYLNEKTGAFVEAIEEGLVLGVNDHIIEMGVACTFVSYDKLKPSQKAAFDTAMPHIKVYAKRAYQMMAQGQDKNVAEDIVTAKFKEVAAIAEEIYAQFYNKDLR